MCKKLIKFSQSIMISFLLIYPCMTNAQVVEAVTVTIPINMAVNNIIDNLEGAASRIARQLDDIVSARSFQIRNDLAMLQAEIKRSADELVGKTFGELSKQQQLFFNNATKTLADIESSLNKGLDRIDELASKVESIVAQFPFTKEEPRVTGFDPFYLNPPIDSKIHVKINGSFLRHGDAKLVGLRNINCEKIGHNDSKISFVCPKEMFQTKNGSINYNSAQLIVNSKKGFLDFSKKTKDFKIPFVIIPSK